MAKYHINNETGAVGMCRATKRCPFGDLEKDHYKTAQEAREIFEASQDTFSSNPAFPPLAEATISAKPKIPADITFDGVEVKYDHYGPPSYYGCECDPDDYCRCSVYEGLEVESVNMERVLSKMTGIPENEIPESLKLLGVGFNLNNEGGYDINTYHDYYGEEYDVTVANSRELQKALDKWHARNCIDENDKVSLYLASRGHDPRKMNALKLMKKHLKDKVSPELLQNVKHVAPKKIAYSDVKVPAEKKVYPKLSTALPVNPQVRGVLLKTSSGYELIDGFEEYSRRKSTASSSVFIVLE